MQNYHTQLCSIIIPVFNQVRYTKECIEAIFHNTEYPLYEIIIVNNGSSDETLSYITFLKENNSNIKIINYSDNKGFSKANNDGAKIADGYYFIFLNNDTVPQKGWLLNLVSIASNEKVGVVGSKLIYPDTKKINHAGYVFNKKSGCFYLIYHNFNSDIPAVNKQREFQAVLGACMLVKKDIFMQVGMFAEYGFEDVDLCLKVRAKGYKVVYSPKSCLYHYGSITLKNSPKGSILKRDLKEFNKTWKQEYLIWDDITYYEEDGYKISSYDKDGNIVLTDLTSYSNKYLNEAIVYKNNGEINKAIDLFCKAIEIHPYNKTAYINIISTLVEINDFSQAIIFCEKLLKIDPAYYDGYVYCSQLFNAIGEIDKAYNIIQKLLTFKDISPSLRNHATVLMQDYKKKRR